jgi:biotin transport system substrate-specific component
VFTNGGGLGYVLQPTFGYLLGLIAGAFVCGIIVKKAQKLTMVSALLAALACMFTVYLFGLPYLYLMMNLYLHRAISVGAAAMTGFVLFIPGDLLKCAVASLLVVKLKPALAKTG